MPDTSSSSIAAPARQIVILSISIAIGLGICRFAYSLVLPDMRDSLGWSYSAAGFMNTVNAAAYLIGALVADAFIRRVGALHAVRIGTLVCVVSLAMSALSGNFVFFSAARFLSGLGAAFAMIGGAALASTLAQTRPAKAPFLISLFLIGPAIGLLVSGLVSPFLLEWLGRGSWWIVWAMLAVLSAAMGMLLANARIEATLTGGAQSAAATIRLPPVLPYLTGYLLFGAGYIAYMTFMIAYVRDRGGGALAQSAFWSVIAVGALAAPWTWAWLLARSRAGGASALLVALTAIGAVLPMLGTSPPVLLLSGLIFGNAFFTVVTSTTAFTRVNYPREAWPKGIALMTIAFGLGQIVGPFVTGAITDATGSLDAALEVSAATLVLGAICCALQRPLQSTARG